MKSMDTLKSLGLALALTAGALGLSYYFDDKKRPLISTQVPQLRAIANQVLPEKIEENIQAGNQLARETATDVALPGSEAFLLSKEQIEALKDQLFSEKMETALLDYAFQLESEPKDKTPISIEEKMPGATIKRYADGSSFTHMSSLETQLTERHSLTGGDYYIRRLRDGELWSAEWNESGENYHIDMTDQGRIHQLIYRSESKKIEFVNVFDYESKKYKRYYRSLIDGSRVFF